MQAKIRTGTRPYQHRCHFCLCPGPGALGIFHKGPSGGVTVSMLPNLLPVKMCLKTESVPSSALRWELYSYESTFEENLLLLFHSSLFFPVNSGLKVLTHSFATERLTESIPWLPHEHNLVMFSVFMGNIYGTSCRIQISPMCGSGFVRSRCWDETGRFSDGL